MDCDKTNAFIHAAGATLSICAGMVNSVGFFAFSSSVSHMTGSTSKAALGLEGTLFSSDAFQVSLGMVSSFALGSFLSGLIIKKDVVHLGVALYGVALVGNAGLLITATLLGEQAPAKYIMAVACGLQNAMTTQYNGAVVRTTHATGTVTDAAMLAGRLISRVLRRRCRGRELQDLDCEEMGKEAAKLLLLTLPFFSFFLGVLIGAFLYRPMEMAVLAIPAAISGTAGFAYMGYRYFVLGHRLWRSSSATTIDTSSANSEDDAKDKSESICPGQQESGCFVPASLESAKDPKTKMEVNAVQISVSSKERVSVCSKERSVSQNGTDQELPNLIDPVGFRMPGTLCDDNILE